MILAPGGTDTPSGLFIKGAVLSSFHTFRLDYDINTKTQSITCCYWDFSPSTPA